MGTTITAMRAPPTMPTAVLMVSHVSLHSSLASASLQSHEVGSGVGGGDGGGRPKSNK